MVTAALTRAGSVFGTPHYMAPEQIEGKSVGPEADLYALGAVLYELVSGEPPYDGASVIDILLKHVKAPIPSLAQPGRTLPAGLDALVTRLLAKKAADRPQSAAEVRDLLVQIRAGLSGEAAQGPGPVAVVSVSDTAEPARPFDRTVDAEPAAAEVMVPASPGDSAAARGAVPPLALDLPDAAPKRQFAGFGAGDDDARTLVGVGVGRGLDQTSRPRSVAPPPVLAPPPPAPPPAPPPPPSAVADVSSLSAVQAPGAVEVSAHVAPARAPTVAQLAGQTGQPRPASAPPIPPRPAGALGGQTRRPPPGSRPVGPPPPAPAAAPAPTPADRTVELSQIAMPPTAAMPDTVVERAPGAASDAGGGNRMVWMAVAVVVALVTGVVLWLALRG
jgi:serine/threonine-protein kinase